MKILVIGSGGREHAIIWKLAQSPQVSELFCAPGNPGIARHATCVPLTPTEIARLAEFAGAHAIDLTVVGPEGPLAEGIVDLFRSQGKKIFGPSRSGAELEWSKVYAKAFMERHGIPTARHRTFRRDQTDAVRAHFRESHFPLVLKADGLASGKGVLICSTLEEAEEAWKQMTEARVFGGAADRVVIEEFLTGQEASVFAICDGKNFLTLAPAQDHKRAYDGDAGKNTGGMGAYAPAPMVTPEILRAVEERIIAPTLMGMASEGRPYTGCLYVGLMLTPDGPKVVEYNVRLGDPEAQVVLPLFEGDLAELLLQASVGGLAVTRPSGPMARSAVCVVLASAGYPDAYRSGLPIAGLAEARGESAGRDLDCSWRASRGDRSGISGGRAGPL
jgi:phosphoribosylamine--glycine ligase